MTLDFSDVSFDLTQGISSGTDINFIPPNTTYLVKADGSGDFETIKDAVDYLEGKWSTGTVTIELEAGTFEFSSQVNINQQNTNIPLIVIKGQGASSTILKNTNSTTGQYILGFYKANAKVSDLSLLRDGGSKSTNYRGILVEDSSKVFVKNVSATGINRIVYVAGDSHCELSGTISFTSGDIAIACAGSKIYSGWQATWNITDANRGLQVTYGGLINGYNTTCNFTDVTTKTSQTVGTATNDGWITGITV